MKSVKNPREILEVLSSLEPSDSDVIAVGLAADIFATDAEIISINNLDYGLRDLQDWYKSLYSDSKVSHIVIAHTKVDDDDFTKFIEYVDDLINNNEAYSDEPITILDSLEVDWTNRTHISDMCENMDCCDPDEPNKF